MATIRRRKTQSGRVRWYVEIRRKGHRAIRQTFATKTAAANWATGVEEDLRKRRLQPLLEAERHTVSEAIDRYLDDHLAELGSARDRRDRRGHLAWWRQRIGHLTLAAVTPAAISDARRELVIVRSVSGATSNRYLAAISSVLGLAQREWLWTQDNPCRHVRRRPESRGRVRYLSDRERKRLLEACKASGDTRLYPLVLFAITTGARQGELLGLRWHDIDLVHLRATLHKTKNRDRRTIAFPGTAGAVLRTMARTPSITGWLFPGPRCGRPRFPQKAWQAAIVAAEIQDFRFHDCRHTFASYLAMSGATLAEIAAAMGHRTLSQVQRYAHIAEQHTEGVVSRMAERFLT